MENSIVFDTCMQIRYNYDGCKKGMRPSGGRCVPAKGRMAQGGGGKAAAITGGVLGAGALGAAIALPLAFRKKKEEGSLGNMTARREKMAETRLGAKENNARKENSTVRDVRQFKREQGVPEADRRIPKTGERRRPEDPRMMGRSGTSLAEASEEVDIAPVKNSDPRKLGRGQGDRRIPTERRRPANPRMSTKDSAAQLVFDALSFVLSDRY